MFQKIGDNFRTITVTAMIIYLATKSTFKSRQKQNTVSYIENCQNKQVNRGVLKVSEL